MSKLIKRIVVTALTLAIMLSGISYSTADAASEKVTWSACHINIPGVPSSDSKVGYATLNATSEEYTGKVESMSNITNRKLTIKSTTHTISNEKNKVVYNNVGKDTWKISGSIKKVTYKMTARTTLQTVLNVQGFIKR